MGLMGETPEDVNTLTIYDRIDNLKFMNTFKLLNELEVNFSYRDVISFIKNKRLPYHTNGMKFRILNVEDRPIYTDTYYSVGGGFIIDEDEVVSTNGKENKQDELSKKIPFKYNNATELLNLCRQYNMRICDIAMENEKVFHTESEINAKVDKIVNVMQKCIEKGLITEGKLPGRLRLTRRAPSLYKGLQDTPKDDPFYVLNLVNSYALAVSEENAAGGQVVTAPTNGASGIIPAVFRYFMDFFNEKHPNKTKEFLFTAAAIGAIFKKNATISGAEGGCQAEIGVSCSMAAGALTAALGGTIEQVECAAEIAMEHFIGLTCDPVNGLVQVPCIERNTMAAQQAINSYSLAMSNSLNRKISLDQIVLKMKQTGDDMKSKYKETSKGGLAKVIDDDLKEKQKHMISKVNKYEDEVSYMNDNLI